MEQRGKYRPNFRRPHNMDVAPASQPAPVQHHQTHQPKTKKIGFLFGRKWLVILIAVLIAGLGFITYEYIHTKNQLNAAKNPETAGKTEIEQIQSHINGTVNLPNETPTLATVSDAAKLKTQVFFKD